MSDIGISDNIKKNVLIKKLLEPKINVGLNIDEKVIINLQLNIHNTRDKRRKIARKSKIDWNFYRALEYEIGKRMKANRDLKTGKTYEELQKEQEEQKTKPE